MPTKIYLDEPNISDKDIFAIKTALVERNISTVGNQIEEFENAIADYLGGGVFCTATNSGSAALFVALKVLDIGPGDEVIIPATTFIATANAVAMTGAKPVVVDIDANTWNIDPVEIHKAITLRTKAIIPVHLYGNPCNIDEIMNISRKYKLWVIEDACESLGATYNGKHMGTFGHVGCFSFNRNKVITTGGGGMIVANNKELAEEIKQFVNNGRNNNGLVFRSGFNFGMTNQNASLGLSQLNRLDEFLELKEQYHNIYSLINANQTDFTNAIKSNYWFNAIAINRRKINKSILQIQEELKSKGIPTRRIFEPLNAIKPYEVSILKTPNAIDLYLNGICLPSSTLNTYEGIEYVCKTLLEVLN